VEGGRQSGSKVLITTTLGKAEHSTVAVAGTSLSYGAETATGGRPVRTARPEKGVAVKSGWEKPCEQRHEAARTDCSARHLGGPAGRAALQ